MEHDDDIYDSNRDRITNPGENISYDKVYYNDVRGDSSCVPGINVEYRIGITINLIGEHRFNDKINRNSANSFDTQFRVKSNESKDGDSKDYEIDRSVFSKELGIPDCSVSNIRVSKLMPGKKFINLSSSLLTPEEINTLSKGLGFVVSPKDIPFESIIYNIENGTQGLSLDDK